MDSYAIMSNPTDQVMEAQTLSLNPEETIQLSIGNELVFNCCSLEAHADQDHTDG